MLAGCAVQNGSTQTKTSPSPGMESDEPITQSEENQQSSQVPALWFSGEIPDPQDMQPTYERGTLTYEGTLISKESGDYEAAFHLTRYFPQGINFMTGEAQPDCYINISYDSIGSMETSELPEDVKTVLDEKSTDDTGQRQYGMLPMRIRNTQNTAITTSYSYLSAPSLRQYCGVAEIPYLLTTQDDKATLYLHFNSLATVKLDGTLTVPPAPEIHQATAETKTLYFNDEGRTTEQNKQKDIWNILFLGEKSGDSYNGDLRLWRWREQTGAYPTTLWYLPGETDTYEQTVSLQFKPFNEEEYLSAGSQLNARERARLSSMATALCGEQIVIFTICCDTVYAELPGVTIGVLEGTLTDSKDLQRIHDESLTLYELAYQFHNNPPNPPPTDLEYGAEGMAGASASDMAENRKALWGKPNGVPSWMPNVFISMIRPVELIEKRPSTVGNANFQYTEDGYWLDDIEPLYRELLADMRDLQFEVSDDGYGPVMEIVFRYVERTVVIETQETIIGTWVSATIY